MALETSWPLDGPLPSAPEPVKPPDPSTILDFEQLQSLGIQALVAFSEAHPEAYARLKRDLQFRLERPKTFSAKGRTPR